MFLCCGFPLFFWLSRSRNFSAQVKSSPVLFWGCLGIFRRDTFYPVQKEIQVRGWISISTFSSFMFSLAILSLRTRWFLWGRLCRIVASTIFFITREKKFFETTSFTAILSNIHFRRARFSYYLAVSLFHETPWLYFIVIKRYRRFKNVKNFTSNQDFNVYD